LDDILFLIYFSFSSAQFALWALVAWPKRSKRSRLDFHFLDFQNPATPVAPRAARHLGSFRGALYCGQRSNDWKIIRKWKYADTEWKYLFSFCTDLLCKILL